MTASLRRLAPYGILLAAVAAGTAVAVDPPHWTGLQFTNDCTTTCHTLHQAGSAQLTPAGGNINQCLSCHAPSGFASALPLSLTDSAQPGIGGTSHAFGVAAVNAAAGASLPANQQMALRVMGGQIVCSTCHDQHDASSARGGTPRISPAEKVTALTSPLITSSGTYSGPGGLWYLVEIETSGAAGAARFRWSKDNGTSWVATNVATSTGGVTLDNGVIVSFPAGAYVLAERYEFYASWPFLRAALDSGDNATGSKFCRDCHSSWTMGHSDLEDNTGGTKVMSHPVGVALNANGRGYDRAVPLDGNGAVQGSAGKDLNPTNDYQRDSGGRVQCLSCHAPHYADSNTTTVDAP